MAAECEEGVSVGGFDVREKEFCNGVVFFLGEGIASCWMDFVGFTRYGLDNGCLCV